MLTPRMPAPTTRRLATFCHILTAAVPLEPEPNGIKPCPSAQKSISGQSELGCQLQPEEPSHELHRRRYQREPQVRQTDLRWRKSFTRGGNGRSLDDEAMLERAPRYCRAIDGSLNSIPISSPRPLIVAAPLGDFWRPSTGNPGPVRNDLNASRKCAVRPIVLDGGRRAHKGQVVSAERAIVLARLPDIEFGPH